MFRMSHCVQHHQKTHVGIAYRCNLLRAKVFSDDLKIADVVLNGFSLWIMDGIGFSAGASVVENQTTAWLQLLECMNEEQSPGHHDCFRSIANDLIKEVDAIAGANKAAWRLRLRNEMHFRMAWLSRNSHCG
jgi:hypothetical protein